MLSSYHGLASATANKKPESQGDPAVLRLPENYKLTTGASQRVAAASSAAAAVAAEQADFAKSATGIKCARVNSDHRTCESRHYPRVSNMRH